MLAAKGRLRFFTDAGLPYPLEQFPASLAAFESGAEVVIGRRTNVSPYQRMWRRFTSLPFRALVLASMHLPYTDSQCGFKGFRAHTAETLFSCLQTQGYSFDVEVLLAARRQGYRIVEIPVRWNDTGHSSIKLWRDPLQMLWEVLLIWRRMSR
jgi:dolichyl-phosphate beta-glucosyltransferase